MLRQPDQINSPINPPYQHVKKKHPEKDKSRFQVNVDLKKNKKLNMLLTCISLFSLVFQLLVFEWLPSLNQMFAGAVSIQIPPNYSWMMQESARGQMVKSEIPPPFLVINHAWQHRIHYLWRHCYWHCTHCHSSPQRNYKILKEKISVQSIHEPLNQQQPALPNLHSSCEEREIFSTSIVWISYVAIVAFGDFTKALKLITRLDLI